MNLLVFIVARGSQHMEIKEENFAAMNVLWLPDSGVQPMTREKFEDEKNYQITMDLARKLLSDGIISEKDYQEFDTIMLAKYRPIFGHFFNKIRLIQ